MLGPRRHRSVGTPRPSFLDPSHGYDAVMSNSNSLSMGPATGPGIGLVLGVAVGAATDHLGLCIALGLVFGAALGTVVSRRDETDSSSGD